MNRDAVSKLYLGPNLKNSIQALLNKTINTEYTLKYQILIPS